ncbi:MAG TPA: proton-conducting membrane transporter [Aquifex aeolicus]|uniref:Proton-conducting membrane transporter n=1 Tax=Aquifex aeolicus TaxID=63363 RepID=A0A9D0YN17_AQUAO|nr:proton-conducting membrane transporter [Aquificales bacterium]HIP97995.1 proton-conducting membrane transporter [Aquifex aeolicus]HIQ26858.1 proton-conducting membrane transporter [Aquifex aeolicus]
MGKKFVVPFGSQHIAIPEPIRFIFTTENEIIKSVSVDFGYVHRGIEKACMTRYKYTQVPYVVARVCGLCAVSQATAYCMAIESLMDIEIPERAKYLRIIVHEMDRIHSHLFAIAHLSEAAGYENLFMRVMRDREFVMECLEILTGNRIQADYSTIGGVNRDLTKEVYEILKPRLDELERRLYELKEIFERDYTLQKKWKGIGVITLEMAQKYNAVGPVARASGLATDCRVEFEYLPYKELDYKMVLYQEGDVWARNMVRLDETLVSIRVLKNAIDNLPEGDIKVKVKGNPKGEALIRWEAPRGELLYYVKGNGKSVLERLRIKTPTFSVIPVMKELYYNQPYAFVPDITISFDPCLSCSAR